MKKLLYIALVALSLAGVAACADLGFGVDVDSSNVNPYWYGNGYSGNTNWNTPVWNYGPIYNPVPPRPPLIGNGPGSIGMPAPRPQPNPAPSGEPRSERCSRHSGRYSASRKRRPPQSGGCATEARGLRRLR